ncbi:MAG: phytanoyl-CoA dioxygenase family protein [Dermatophilaceae bacterium]
MYRSDRLADYLDSIDEADDHLTERFQRDGYLAVRHLLDPPAVRDALDGLAAVLDRPERVDVQWEAWATEQLDTTAGENRMDLVRRLMSFVSEDHRLTAVAAHPDILSVVRRLCGSEEISMFQDMALLKPPGGGREKPWHQDNAYFAYEPGTPIVGVWIALDDATIDNGCMHVLPGTHRDGAAPHVKRRDWQLCDAAIDHGRDTAVPLPPGGALFFHGLLHHGTPPNLTSTRRRAVQLHYLPTATPQVPDERRLDIFGSEGRNVTC